MASFRNLDEQRRPNRGVALREAAGIAAGLDAAPPQPPFTIGGRYEVTATLGEGGMGAVYEARDTLLGRNVAIKVMLPRYVANQQASQRFFREAQALARLSHPNILTL